MDLDRPRETVTIVLVPGLLCDAFVWQPAIERLKSRFSVAVADVDRQDSIPAMAADALAANPGRLLVAGHSMGARVAMEMARQAPDRVERLALLDTGSHPYVKGEETKRLARVALAYEKGMAALAEDWLPGMVHAPRRRDRALMDALADMVCRKTPEIHERQIRALLDRPDARAYLKELRMPTLVAVGRQDQWSPLSQHEELAALLPNATLQVIDQAGHFAPVEQPEATIAIIEHWAMAA